MLKQCRIIWVIIKIAFLLLPFRSVSQEKEVQVEKYAVLNFRLGSSLKREFAFYLNPTPQKASLLMVGLGFRYGTKDHPEIECTTNYPKNYEIWLAMRGPYAFVGLDFKNKAGARNWNSSNIIVQVRRFKAERVDVLGCNTASTIQPVMDAKTWDIIGKYYLDMGGNESFIDFYTSLGYGVRFERDFLHKRINNKAILQTSNRINPIFSFELGIRLSFMEEVKTKAFSPAIMDSH